MKLKSSLLAMLTLMAASAPLLAHHGTAGAYDQTRTVKASGVVKEFRWRNPHCALILVGKDESGQEVTYSFEIGSPNSLVKGGFTRNTFKVGDTVSLTMHPAFGNPYIGQPVGRAFIINGKEVKGIAGDDQ